jgi:hypothetical protein
LRLLFIAFIAHQDRVMETGGNNPFNLKDHFIQSPYSEIFSERREDTSFFNAHSDYFQYLRYLAIIWSRIQNECRQIGVYHSQEAMISYEVNPKEWTTLITAKEQLQTQCQCDIETFVMFGRRFMDKVAELIELLIDYPNYKRPEAGFTKHKEWFIDNQEIHHSYSDFLEKKTYWYERDLLLLRDKVIGHGGTLTSGAIVSPWTGVGFRKSYGISPLDGRHKERFLEIKRKCEGRYSFIRIPDNPFEMLTDFVREIRRNDIRLDKGQKDKKGDLEILDDIVQYSGIVVEEEYLESIACHIEDFLQETASIFKQ